MDTPINGSATTTEEKPLDSAAPTDAAPQPAGTSDGTSTVGTENSATPTVPADYKDVLARLDTITKSHKEVQGFSTRTSQENAALRKQLAAITQQQQEMAATLAKAFEKPHDPDAFMEELRQQGPAFVNAHIQKQLEAARKADLETVSAMKNDMAELRYNHENLVRRNDTKNYPDFEKLEPEMAKAAADPATPVDFTKPIGVVLDSLYQFVRLQHSQDALAAAAKAGRQDAEGALAREAATTVAGGGKNPGPSTVDPAKLDAAALRKLAIERGMVSDS